MDTVVRGLPLFAVATSLLVGTYVISRDPDGRANRYFLAIAIALSLWGFGEFVMKAADSATQAMWGARIGAIGWCLVGPLFLSFTLVLTESKPGARGRFAVRVSYLLGVTFLILTWSTELVFREFAAGEYPGYREVSGLLRVPSMLFVASVFVAGLAVLVRYYRATASKEKRVQVGLVIAAAMVPVVAGLFTDILLPLAGRPLPFSSQAAGPVMALLVALAVTRYDFMSTVSSYLGSSVVEKIEEAVFIADADGGIESANPAAHQLSGYGPEELKGMDIDRFFTYSPWSASTDPEQSGRESMLCLFNSRDGEAVPVTVNSETVSRRPGTLVGTVVVVRDMRETLQLVQAEYDARFATAEAELERDRAGVIERSLEELLAASDFLESVIDSITEPVFIKDLAGRFVFVNRRTCEMSGLRREDIVGKRSEDIALVPPGVAAAADRIESAVARTGEALTEELPGVRDAEGNFRLFKSIRAPLKNETGEVQFIVGVLIDVTDERRLDRARLDFIRVAAHELRTPLTSLKLGFDLLARETRGALGEEQQRTLDVLSLSIERLSELARNLLDLASIDAGLIKPDLRPVELGPLVGEAVALLSSSVEEKGLEFEILGDGDLRPAFADPSRVSQVLYNLISNAIKYTESGGITVSVRDPGGEHLEVCVADTGVGIPAEQQGFIFTSFVKVPNAEGVKEGTGLGLPISKAVVEAHGGEIWVESGPGKGSKFFFTLRAAG